MYTRCFAPAIFAAKIILLVYLYEIVVSCFYLKYFVLLL
jgi:hypothetical protein